MEEKIVYFDKPGSGNTEEVFRLAKKRAVELGIKTIVVATNNGNTAVRAIEVFKGIKVVAVTHSTGFKTPNFQELTEENRRKIVANGGLILTTHPSFPRRQRRNAEQFNMHEIGIIIANTLRLMGQGMKVAIEISVMAADAGLVRPMKILSPLAAVAEVRTTAVVLKPVNSNDFFDLKVKEILCKPRFSFIISIPCESTQQFLLASLRYPLSARHSVLPISQIGLPASRVSYNVPCVPSSALEFADSFLANKRNELHR